MGKATYKGLVPPDDPIFSGASEIFSRPESSRLKGSKHSGRNTLAVTFRYDK